MDTLHSRRSAWLRRGRILLFLGLIVIVQSAVAHLVLNIEWPRRPLFVSIRVAEYQAGPLAHLGRRVEPLASFAEAAQVGATRQEIQRALDALAQGSLEHPAVVSVSTLAIAGAAGRVFILPADASLDDPSTWLALEDILTSLRAASARHKLLLLDLTPAPVRLGNLQQDLASLVPQELDAVPDAGRVVLTARTSGAEGFAHAVQQALQGDADADHDGRITIAELAASVLAQRGIGFGTAPAVVLRAIDPAAPREQIAQSRRTYPDWLLDAWRARDAAYRTGQHRLTPRLFQQWQATLLALEQAWAAGYPDATLRKRWLTECDRLQEAMRRGTADLVAGPPLPERVAESSKKLFTERWRAFEQQLGELTPVEAERLRARFGADLRREVAPADLDALVFAQALADPKLDAKRLRFYDRLLHPTAHAAPRTAGGACLRLLGDGASDRPADLAEALIRCTASAEKALGDQPALPGFLALLAEPALALHRGEVRVAARGYADPNEAKVMLTTAAARFDRLADLNQRWRACEQALDDALADLPWHLEAIEALPDARASWFGGVAAARQLAETLKKRERALLPWDERVDHWTELLEAAENHARALQVHRDKLHAPFQREALAKLPRQATSPFTTSLVMRRVAVLRGVAAPVLRAEERAFLWNIAGEQLGTPPAGPVDRARGATLRAAAQLALLELAGLSGDALRPLVQRFDRCTAKADHRAGWCELGAALRKAGHDQMPRQYNREPAWRERERLAWLMPCLEPLPGIDDAPAAPTVERRRRDREQRAAWLHDRARDLAADYQGLNVDTPDIVALRTFWSRAAGNDFTLNEPPVRWHVGASIEPLSKNHPLAEVVLEATRPVSAHPLKLRVLRPDAAWLDVTPASTSLPAPRETPAARTVTQRVPLKIERNSHAERSGTAVPLGFLVEASVDGHICHHVVRVPIIRDTQSVQILVSTEAAGPTRTVNDIRLRPGKARQPYHVYVKNLLPRPQRVQIELAAGATLVHKSRQPIALDADNVHKVVFDEPSRKLAPFTGPLTLRVFDQARQKLLEERTLGVEILAPRDYVKITDVTYEPGQASVNKWSVQVQAARLVAGPAIAAQLVLPADRIPGLLGVSGGTLHAEVPTRLASSRTLFAEGIRLIHASTQEGPVYLNIDGVPRAFVYRTRFTHGAKTHEPQFDERPAVRLVAPPCISAGVNLLADVEVDNAPKGTKLEVALGRVREDGSFQAEMVREFSEPKNRAIRLDVGKTALTFEASISDWTATFDTRAVVGARAVDAKLTDAAGRTLASCRHLLVIDDSPPLARFTPTVAAVKKGSVLHLHAQAVDPESGVAQVLLFLGLPQKGEIPPAASRIRAVPATRDRSIWNATVLIPADQKEGPLQVSLYVANHAGLSAIDTITLEVTDRKPGATGLGTIEGRVLEGARPQADLTVTLTDEHGKEIAKTNTQRDGSYRFEQLKPGRYRLMCVKPQSQRRAVLDVRIDADRTVRGELNLTL